MHKRKDGKIIASLTEVKNKTGDIFSLVDEFGEITLTSYNKPKYRITKIDIFDSLEVRDEAPKKSEAKVVETPEIKKEEPKPMKEEVRAETPASNSSSLLSSDILKKLKGFATWNRNSGLEKAFISNIIKPLQ